MKKYNKDYILLVLWYVLFASFFIFWILWLFLGSLQDTETSVQARVEIKGSVYTLESQFDSNVLINLVNLGKNVHKGEVIVQLDDTQDKIHLTKLKNRLRHIKNRVNLKNSLLIKEKESTHLLIELKEDKKKENLAKLEGIDIVSNNLNNQYDRKKQLKDKGVISDSEIENAAAEVAELQNRFDQINHASNLLSKERLLEVKRNEAKAINLALEINQLEEEIGNIFEDISSLKEVIESKQIKSPVDGTIIEVFEHQKGSMVELGDKIATILPTSELQIVSYFNPRRVVGRIKKGQKAIMELDGFPRSYYGSIACLVSSISTEPTNGLLRVEMQIASSPDNLDYDHGQTGTVVISLSEITPLVAILRAAGLKKYKPHPFSDVE